MPFSITAKSPVVDLDKTEVGNNFTAETKTTAVVDANLIDTAFPITATPANGEIPYQKSKTTLPPVPERPTYFLHTTYDYDAHTVTVDEVIIYPNRNGQPLQSLVLAVCPNFWPNSFHLESLSLNNEKNDNNQLEGRRMDIALPAALLPGQAISISLRYRLVLPFIEEVDPAIAGPRIFGYTERQQNLTNWYPFIVPFLDGEWILHEPSYQGEFLVYEASDYDVLLEFTNPDVAPVIASSGFLEHGGDPTSMHYTLKASRAFVFSASREYKISDVQVGDVTVFSYYFPSFDLQGKAVLDAVAQAIEVYSEKFGPYPHRTMSVVMGDFRASMEYSAFFFHGIDSYKRYYGTVDSEFISIAVHETAHQWWFDQVGNDQALAPWLDEALSTYSERIFFEAVSPVSVNGWWWPIRVNRHKPTGFVDSTIYDLVTFRSYVNAVYLQGAHFLEKLRHRIGDDAFFSFLQAYFTMQRGTIVAPDAFWNLLKSYAADDISDLVDKYFKNVY